MDLYERLGVRRGAGAAEVRRAWQRVSRALHPALNPGDPGAAERYRDAAQAFEVLSDPQRRAAYDRGELPPTKVEPATRGRVRGVRFSARVRIETVGFREIFDSATGPAGGRLGAGGGPRAGDAPQLRGGCPGPSVACTSCARALRRLGGAGEVPFGPVPCPRCQGRGTVRGSRGRMSSRAPAPTAAGGASSGGSPAGCGSEGRSVASEWLEVRIPPGVGNASQVRLPGAGNAGRRGGLPGTSSSPSRSRRTRLPPEGDDLHCVVAVGMVEAAMGGHVEVPTPDGKVAIEVPAGTQNGQRFRLRKRGVPHPRVRGGAISGWRPGWTIPAATNDRARALLRELAAVLPRS